MYSVIIILVSHEDSYYWLLFQVVRNGAQLNMHMQKRVFFAVKYILYV